MGPPPSTHQRVFIHSPFLNKQGLSSELSAARPAWVLLP